MGIRDYTINNRKELKWENIVYAGGKNKSLIPSKNEAEFKQELYTTSEPVRYILISKTAGL